MNFSSIKEGMQEIFFEEYGFEGFIRLTGPTLSSFKHLRESVNDFCLIVDSGFSFTHLVPYWRGKAIVEGIRRYLIGF